METNKTCSLIQILTYDTYLAFSYLIANVTGSGVKPLPKAEYSTILQCKEHFRRILIKKLGSRFMKNSFEMNQP